jgi:glycosyltransferase involved in cell wall biosynthesis
MNKTPYISVIVTAYNRKDFILKAIRSVLTQSLDKSEYEIIVIKNFNNKALDTFLKGKNVKTILFNVGNKTV